MKRITLLFIALLAIVGTMEAQFIPSGSAINGARYSGVQNKPNPKTTIEELLVRYNNQKNSVGAPKKDIFTSYERQLLSAHLNAQNSGNRGPQAVLLTEGFDDITTLPGAGYTLVNASDIVGSTGWFQGNETVFPAQSGAPTAYIGANFNNTAGSVINNFMITPVLNLENGDEITFWTRSPTGSTFPDRLEVRVDPTGANTNPSGPASVGSYTELLLEINPTLTVGGYPGVWTQFTATVTGLSGAVNTRVAFRYWVTDGGPVGNNSDYIGIDTLEIAEGAGGPGGPSIVYGNEAVSAAYGSFDATDPSVFTPIGAPATTDEYAGAIDPNNPGTAYVLGGAGAFSSLDILTGVYTSLGNIAPPGAQTWSGIAFDPTSGSLYGISTDVAVSSLFSINIGTVSATLIGNTGMPGAIDMAIDGAGDAWSFDIITDSFYSLNLTTGAATLVGLIGFDANFAQGMTWDPNTDTVYLAAFNNTAFAAEWRIADRATGATTLVGVINPPNLSDMGWVAIPSTGGSSGCPIVSDCNLSDVTPDDATSADIWDRPFADGTCCSGLGPVSYDVYGPFTVDISGLYTIDSDQDGGAWDGYIFLYQTCFDPLDQTTNFVAGDDDGPGGIGTSQILDVNLTAGTEYYLITTGFGAGDFGAFTNAITGVGTASCGPPVVTYDDCAGAIALACGDSVVGETLTATNSGGNAAPDVFYKFTGTGAPQSVTISLCGGGTDYDSFLRVYDDCDLLNELAANDDSCGLQSEVTFFSDGTSTYYIMVEGFGSGSGNFSLDVTCISPPSNDLCSNAISVGCGDSIAGTTIGSTLDTNVAGDCGTTLTTPGVWYSLADTSGLAGSITLSLCAGTDFDSKISVYTGDCGAPPLTCVAGNDDSCGLQSEVTFPTNGNTTFLILVHGFGGATGNFTLDVSCTPTPPPNDRIVNSIDVDEIGFPYTDPSVAMPAATTENGNPQGCDLTGANGVWYNFVAAGDGTAVASIVTPGGASSVTFYTAPDESSTETDLVLVPQNSNQCAPGTSTSIFTLGGQAYYVFVLNSGAITDIVIDGTNLGVSDNAIAGFSYYPNPTTGVLNLRSVDNIEQVSIYSLLGQRVLESRVDATTSQMDISGLSTGTYLMKVTVNGQTGTYKVLKN